MSAIPRLATHLLRRRACSTQSLLLHRQNLKPTSTFPRTSILTLPTVRNLGFVGAKSYSQQEISQEDTLKSIPTVPKTQADKYASKNTKPEPTTEDEGSLVDHKQAPAGEGPLFEPKENPSNDEDLVYPSNTTPEYEGPLFEPKEKSEDEEDISTAAEKANDEKVYLLTISVMLARMWKFLDGLEGNKETKDTLNDTLRLLEYMEDYTMSQQKAVGKATNLMLDTLEKIVDIYRDLLLPPPNNDDESEDESEDDTETSIQECVALLEDVKTKQDSIETLLEEVKKMQEHINRALLFLIAGTFGYGVYSFVSGSADSEDH